VDVAPMAGLDEQQRVTLHEMRRHRDERAIGRQKSRWFRSFFMHEKM
jgi:hypothetical protein